MSPRGGSPYTIGIEGEALAEYQKKYITEMKTGDKIDSVLSVHYKKSPSEYRNGVMFEFRVADRTGQITVKFWGGEDAEEVAKMHSSISRDSVVRVRGTVGEYRGQMEIAINPADGEGFSLLSEGDFELTDLIEKRKDIDESVAKMRELIGSIEDQYLRALLDRVFGDEAFMKRFSECPASIMLHSNEIGGLIHHTMNVADHCLIAWKQYGEMDRDLLLAGALLHDIGKVESFRVTTNINQTEEGIFLGHLIIGMTMAQKAIDSIEGFPKDKRNKLLHILLSHHGRKEWGSPVEPAIPEALTIHYADDFDAKLEYMLIRREEATTDDSWLWDTRFRRHIYLG